MNESNQTLDRVPLRVNLPSKQNIHPRKALPVRWRCSSCGKVLGIRLGPFVEIFVSGRLFYRVSTPAMATCPRCRKLNELP